ncbi:MAG TPA: tetratricopeptide repeat protein [Bryobacteraceae bacterium]|jgi:tetratricopeptide (TPR) repeat protein|nr:tetratricopeptide repeat protein [Bryobacteraceae bacterium]
MWAIAVALFFLQSVDFNAEGMKALEEAKYDDAVQAFNKAIEADPKDYAAHFNLALAYSFLHKDEEGVAEYRKTLELKPELYEAQLNAGILLMRRKDPAAALPLLVSAVEQKPKEFRPRYYLAEAQLATGDLEKAGAGFQVALELDPKSANAELGLAHALARQGKLSDADPHFRQAAGLDPRYRDYLLELASLYERARQPAEAIKIYREFPDNAAAQEHLGQLMLENKEYADAIPRLESAFGKDPTAANRAALAAAYLFAGQIDKALPLLDQAVQAEPTNYDLRMMYARALRDKKQFPQAANQFYAAAKLKPGESMTWSELGGMLYMTGEYQPALAAFDKARDLGENTPGNWFLHAIILDKLKQVKPALEAYQKFLSMSQGKNPDQEFQARHRVVALKLELEKR